MAKARLLEDITVDGVADVLETLPKPPARHSDVTLGNGYAATCQKHKSNPSRAGINSNSPVVYVSEQMKRLLRLLKADICIREGDSLSENAILSKIIKEYCQKSRSEFYVNFKSIIDSL